MGRVSRFVRLTIYKVLRLVIRNHQRMPWYIMAQIVDKKHGISLRNMDLQTPHMRLEIAIGAKVGMKWSQMVLFRWKADVLFHSIHVNAQVAHQTAAVQTAVNHIAIQAPVIVSNVSPMHIVAQLRLGLRFLKIHQDKEEQYIHAVIIHARMAQNGVAPPIIMATAQRVRRVRRRAPVRRVQQVRLGAVSPQTQLAAAA